MTTRIREMETLTEVKELRLKVSIVILPLYNDIDVISNDKAMFIFCSLFL